VLCTATQPALDPLFKEYLQKTPCEICPPELRKEDIFKRVTFHKSGKLTKEELAEGLNRQPQVLCIVNSRAAAQELYGMLEEEGRYRLSTLMPPAERQKQLQIIRDRLKDGQPCRVVSTSLIEAGVDVDFPTVYREMAGLDSILQAAGRCNRNGGRPREDSNVWVFESEWRTPAMLDTAIGACQSVWDGAMDPLEEAIMRNFFE
jgi:CRISPR-associated endonuclease/helicase Cas3